MPRSLPGIARYGTIGLPGPPEIGFLRAEILTVIQGALLYIVVLIYDGLWLVLLVLFIATIATQGAAPPPPPQLPNSTK